LAQRPAFHKGDTVPHGKICYLEIPAKTGEASADFYSSIFGWKIRKRGDGAIAFDDPGGVSGTWVKEGDYTADERTRTYIMVDNITDSLKKIEASGGACSPRAPTSERAWVPSRYSPTPSETSSVYTRNPAS
jgi:uncharacterized protein